MEVDASELFELLGEVSRQLAGVSGWLLGDLLGKVEALARRASEVMVAGNKEPDAPNLFNQFHDRIKTDYSILSDAARGDLIAMIATMAEDAYARGVQEGFRQAVLASWTPRACVVNSKPTPNDIDDVVNSIDSPIFGTHLSQTVMDLIRDSEMSNATKELQREYAEKGIPLNVQDALKAIRSKALELGVW